MSSKPLSTIGHKPALARRLGLFDATMIVMGGIIGSGIFINPYVVAQRVTTPFLILFVWALGGLVALIAAFIWAELAALRPEVGGQYAYLRDAYHPMAAFLYGWGLLLVIQTGGMAATALIFARFTTRLTGLQAPEWSIAMAALLALTVINCLGVALGSAVQTVLMLLKIAAIGGLILCGLFLAPAASVVAAPALPGAHSLAAFGAAMGP